MATNSPMPNSDQHPLVFIDGVCTLCNRTVLFLINRDSNNILRFASLQGSLAGEMLDGRDIPQGLKTVVLLERGKLYFRSTAVLRICRNLKFPWNLMSGFLIVPGFIRNPVYNFRRATPVQVVWHHRKKFAG